MKVNTKLQIIRIDSKHSTNFNDNKPQSTISTYFIFDSKNSSFPNLRQMNILNAINIALVNRYSTQPKDYIAFQINNIIENKLTHKLALFKDNMILYYKEEFLKREYKRRESIDRIPKFITYYKNYLVFFCRPTFSNFRFNKIIQAYEKRRAQVYYNGKYAKKNKDNKEKTNLNYMKVFSASIRENINANESNLIKNYHTEKSKLNNKYNEDNNESTLHLTSIDENKLRDKEIANRDNDSMLSILNLINNNSDNKANDLAINYQIKSSNDNNTIRINLNAKGALRQLIENKPTPTNQVKYKLKANPQYDQFHTEMNQKNYIITETVSSRQNNKNNKEMNKPNVNMIDNLNTKQRQRHVRNAISTLPITNTTERVTTNEMKMYSTQYPVINTTKNANIINKALSPLALSPKIQTAWNKNDNNTKEGVDGKTMNHFHQKTNSMVNRNETKQTHRSKQLFLVSNAAHSLFSNYDKQQQILNSNSNNQRFTKRTTISISKEENNISYKNKNCRLNSVTFKIINEKPIVTNNKTKSINFNINTNINTRNDQLTSNHPIYLINEPLKAFLRIRKQQKSNNNHPNH